MIEQKAQDVYFDIDDAILNEEFTGFKEDYLILHSLIRRYKPKTFFEIGTNCGTGTNIICNAMKLFMAFDADHPTIQTEGNVYSLDLPTELAHISLQHPISEGKGDKVGINCQFPYTQLRGDSMTFDFSEYPCEGYFIDGEHDQEHAFKETWEVILRQPKIIIYHDADIKAVFDGLYDAWKCIGDEYDLFRVIDTRILYALKTRNLFELRNGHLEIIE